MSDAPADRETSTLQRLLAEEQAANARSVSRVRLWGVSGFLALFLLLGVVLGLREWRGNLVYFAPYWAVSAAIYVAVRRGHFVRASALSIAFVDVPLVFLLQWAQFPVSPNVGAIAAYNLGIYVLLVILAALSLEDRVVYTTAATAALFEILLQHLAEISIGAMVATAIVMAMAAAACAYGSRRLFRLVTRVARDLEDRRRSDRALADARGELAVVSREMAIASRIQTSILPRDLAVADYDIAAYMQPASTVGGDYYDVRRAASGCWIGIGDVTGHGVDAGLVMMMMQTAVTTLVGAGHDDPAILVRELNAVLYDNVRRRLGRDDHATFTMLRLHADGRLCMAGRHEPIIVWRAGERRCEVLDTPGTWIGLRPRIDKATTTTTHQLAPGDLVLLHTDGVTEAANATGERFGLDRLVALVTAMPGATADALAAQLRADHETWCARRDDDVTFVIVRYVPVAEPDRA